jgi:hypothetical protein
MNKRMVVIQTWQVLSKRLSENHATRLHLKEVRQLENDVLWLRYKIGSES